MTQIWYTIKFSTRMLAARPIMTVLAVLTMGVGIGVTTSQMMIYQGIMFPDISLPKPEQIVSVTSQYQGKAKQGQIHSHLFNYWDQYQNKFDALVSYNEGTVNVFFQNRAIRYGGSWVNAGFFDALGVEPILGEGFLEGDDQLEMPKKAVLGFEAWEKDFNSDPSIIGKQILVNSETAMVVGVMPKGFAFPYDSHIWIPDVFYPGELVAYDTHPAAYVGGRLKDGISFADAENELNELTTAFLNELPEPAREAYSENSDVGLMPYVASLTDNDTKNVLYLSSTVVILVLLIACSNVTNLLLAGFSTRMKEMAIRCALGASRRHIAFQLWSESFMISVAGALVGVIYCMWAGDWGNAQLQNMEAPFWTSLSFSPQVVLLIGVITVLSAFLAGLLPVLKANHLSINQVLQDDSRTGSSLNIGITNKTLVVLQISISCALLMVAGIMIKQIHSLRTIDTGFDTHSVLGARMGLLEGKYNRINSTNNFIESLLTILNDQDEIAAASITTRMRLIGPNRDDKVRVTQSGGSYVGEPIPVSSEGISPQFFETLNVNLIEGRLFDDSEIPFTGIKEVIVTEEFRDKYLGPGSAIGKKIELYNETVVNPALKEFEVIGVVKNTFARGGIFDGNDRAGVHFHYSALRTRFITIVIRPSEGLNPYSLAPLLKRCVAEVDQEIPLYFVETPHDSIEAEFAGLRFSADLFILFSAVALFLCFVGIFGITTFSVLERIQEIGIRKAVGASGGEVFGMVFRKGGVELGVGLLLGTVAGLSLTFALNSIFLKTGLIDPVVYFVVVLILAFSSLMATLYPARKASLIQPAEATRVN